ncbi:hypothetical protein FQY83_15155 [Luteimonas marina]|uniref:PepSY domain-containing protein n=1 Tax=Luteimonas marina TaxID=488485 RepID=A0A5C5TYA9_9GAMM|nr:hypothetical protein [Luteimonas marina]TWT18704.1 hypothetical protein FQY83_15155 [Luteimonas marina]
MTAAPVHLPKIVLATALALAGVASAWAQDPPRERRGDEGQRANRAPQQQGRQDDPARPRGRDALSDSVRHFERTNRGSRVLSAERMQSDGRDVNRIKAMDDRGRVRVYVDDPQRRSQEPPRRPPTRDDHD